MREERTDNLKMIEESHLSPVEGRVLILFGNTQCMLKGLLNSLGYA